MENKDKFEKYSYKKDGNPVFFLHFTESGRTLAVNPILVSDLNYAINEFSDGTIGKNGKPEIRNPGRFVVNVGMSRLHPEDRYDKAIGRDVSMGRMKQDYAWVNRAIIDSKGIMYQVHIGALNMVVNLMAKHGEDFAYPVSGYCLH